jgi:putative phosphoesterase
MQHPQVAILSDTHGQVDAKLKKLFRNASLLVHAGDVHDAPTLALVHKLVTGLTCVVVRGNNDTGELATKLPEVAVVDVQGVRILCAHRADDAAKALADSHYGRARVVVTGHSHKPAAGVKDGRLWVNPGGAGPKRFNNTRAAALLEVRPEEIVVKIHSLEDEALPIIGEARLPAPPARAQTK